jgi:hypothetical protein
MSISQTLSPTAFGNCKRLDQTMTAGEPRPAKLESPVSLVMTNFGGSDQVGPD